MNKTREDIIGILRDASVVTVAALVEYVEAQRADERGQWVQRWITDSERQRATIEAIAAYSTFGPDGSLDGADVVLRADVLDMLGGESE